MIRFNKILTWIADVGYNYMITANFWINSMQSKMGIKKRWSFSKYLKHSVKNICMYISCFEQTVCRYAKDYGCDGVICGHIHNPSVSVFQGVEYYNCGDWLEDSSMIVEQQDGQIVLMEM
jgi:UDP-2,3-diacylglucosamine pyrophosphatase LpxH